jgi:hypothetical protein
MKPTVNSKIRLAEVEQRLHKACDQMSLLHHTIKNIQLRHSRAAVRGHSVFVQSLDLKLQVLQSVYNAYYSCAAKQAQQLMLYSVSAHNMAESSVVSQS